MIPLDRVQAHGAAAIADFPVMVRYNMGEPFQAAFASNADDLDLVSGGIRHKQGGTLCASAPVWPAGATQSKNIQVQQADSTWLTFIVKSVKGLEDPLASEVYAVIEEANL